jgi:regulator of cell morphogenesis and NO signaling
MMTVGQLVAERPERGRLFERLGIDYCCAGRVTLDEACAKRGLDPANVRAQLKASYEGPVDTREPDWTKAPLTALADHIEATHHRFTRSELVRAAALVSKVARVHGDRHPELVELRRVFEEFAGELAVHMDKEESVLFPWVRALEAGRTAGMGIALDQPVRAMMAEHDDAGRALARMRELTNGFTPPMDACGTFRVMLSTLREIETDMHLHVHKENNILFPRALAVEALKGRGG